MRRFEIRPYSDDCETILYRKPTFEFEPGVTVLLGCNGSGKTTLMNRMAKLLKDENVPVRMLMKQSVNTEIEKMQYFGGDIQALMTQVSRSSMSEGEHAKLQFATIMQGLGTFMTKPSQDAKEVWLFIDGMDSSLSEDQLDDVSGFIDAVIELENPNIETYVIVSTNQFTLAKNRKCIRVTDGHVLTPKSFTTYRNAVLTSAKHKNNAKQITDAQWAKKYEEMRDATKRCES